MRSVRRRVRAWVTTWLVCQVAAVSAFAPRECCEAHRPAVARAATGDAGHHHAAPAGGHAGHHANPGHQPAAAAAGHAHHHAASSGTAVRTAGATRNTTRAGMCPMRGPNGEPCPMHADQAAVPAGDAASAHTLNSSAPGGRECVMRGACRGPITAVVTLFLTPADPLHVYTLAADLTRGLHVGPGSDPTLDLSPSVFTPPPRA